MNLIRYLKYLFIIYIIFYSQIVLAQEKSITRDIFYSDFWNPHPIEIDKDIDSLFFKVYYIDKKSGVSYSKSDWEDLSDDIIKSKLENNKCYLELYVNNDSTKKYHSKGEVILGETEPVMGGEAKEKYIWIEYIKFGIKIKNVKSSCILNCRILSKLKEDADDIKEVEIDCLNIPKEIVTTDKLLKTLTIRSIPKSAKLFLNSEFKARTPTTQPIKEDSVQVRLQKIFYKDTTKTIYLTSTIDTATFKLEKTKLLKLLKWSPIASSAIFTIITIISENNRPKSTKSEQFAMPPYLPNH